MPRHSHAINQPDRFSVNSFDDPMMAQNPQESSFNLPLNTPLLNLKGVQLLRATIPQATIQIPDYSLMFFYYNLPTATAVPTDANLKCVRLYPSTYGYSGVVPFVFTRSTFLNNGLTSLVAQLNTAAAAGGDTVTRNIYWTAGDVVFSVAGNGSQVVWNGTQAGRYYVSAGWNDPIVIAAMQAGGISIAVQSSTAFLGYRIVPQPYAIGYTMNRRIGFAMSGQTLGLWSSLGSNPIYAVNTNTPSLSPNYVIPDSYPNLSGTSVVNIYASVAGPGGNSSDPQNPKNLLATVPMTAVLTNCQFTGNGMKCYIYKCPPEVYALSFTMTDDQGQDYLLPDNANVNLELSLIYNECDY